MVILNVSVTFLRILLFNSCYWLRHSTRTVFRSPTEHLLVGENNLIWQRKKSSLTASPAIKHIQFNGQFRWDSTKQRFQKSGRNDEELQQQNCHIIVYQRESWQSVMLHEVTIDFGVWLKLNVHRWNARINFECHYIVRQTFNMIILISWWFVEPLDLQIFHTSKPSEDIWWQRRSKWIYTEVSVKVNRLEWAPTICWLNIGRMIQCQHFNLISLSCMRRGQIRRDL